MNWEALVAALVAGLLIYSLFRSIRHNPEAFSKANLAKGSYTLGLLALALMGLILFCILLLKN